MFCNFAKNSKIQNGRRFLRENFFFENWHGYSAEIPCGSKILSKSLYLAGFLRYISIFMFCNFCEKFENSKWPPFLARQNFFKIGITTPQRYPVGQNFVEIALSSRVFEI